MSVLIKGMEMPKKGVYFAVISFDGDSLSIRIPPSKKPFFDGRIEEIPTPHGRLIDADEIEKCVHEWYDVGEYVFADTIRNADTIIEAEVSE